MAVEFPALIKLEYQRGNAAKTMLADLQSALDSGKRRFEEFSSEAQRQLDQALSVKRNATGSLDLGVEQLKASAAALQARATAAREVAQATALAAKEEGDYGRQARLAVAATEALAVEEQRAAQAALAHARAAEQVQDRLNRQASATDAIVAASRRGTDANGSVINSNRASRVAFIQLGQQMQDVAVQAQLGTNAMIIFGQQVPQAAFALSGLAGSANKTQAAIGRFATFLSGPWGAAIFIAIAALGPLVQKLFETGDEAKKGGTAIENLANKLDLSKNSYDSLTKVVDEYNKAQSKSNALTYDAIIAAENQARANLKVAETEIAKAKALDPASYGGTSVEGIGFANTTKASAIGVLQDQIDQLKLDLAGAGAAAGGERVKRATDPRYNLEVGYDSKLNTLIEQRKKNVIDQVAFERESLKVTREKIAALEAFDKAHRGSSRGEYGREIDSAAARSIATAAGFQVNSADRTIAQQKALYDKWVAAGRPKSNPVAFPDANAPHVRGDALDIQSGSGVTADSIRKAYAAQGVRLTKILKEDGHFHIEWSTSGADKVENEAKRLAEFGERAKEQIAGINSRFDEAPRLIDAAAASTRDLDAIIKDLSERKPVGFEALIADAQAAKGTIEEALVRPFKELTRDSERRLEVQGLLLSGREAEATALQEVWRLENQIGNLTDAQKQDVLEQVRYEQAVTEELRRRQELQNAYLDATRSVRQELVAILSGTGKLANFKTIFANLRGQVLAQQIFGPVLDDFDKWVKGGSGLEPSIKYLGTQTETAGDALRAFAATVNSVRQDIASGGAGTGSSYSDFLTSFDATFAKAANDNQQIVATGIKPDRNSAGGVTFDTFLTGLTRAVVKPLVEVLSKQLDPRTAEMIGGGLASALKGYAVGGAAGGILGALAGIPGLDGALGGIPGKGLEGLQQAGLVNAISNSLGLGLNNTGSQIGGAVGQLIPGVGGAVGSVVGGFAGKSVGGAVGAGLGAVFGGPIGAIVGSILGNLIGGLFHSAKYGNASFQNGALNVNSNDAAGQQAGTAAGSDLLNTLNTIVSALDATLGSFNVSLGQTDGKFRISTTGRTGELKSGYSDVQVFGTGDAAYQAALKAAVADAISDGAIKGISQAAQNILKAGGDLQKAIEKAVAIQSIPKRLKQLTDPVGYALEELNKEFTKLIGYLHEGSASAAEFADAQKLYELERAKAIKEASAAITGSLRGLLDELTIGNDALSLRDRRSAAYAKYAPLAARVQAGDTTAYDDFAQAARDLLSIQRSISGSQTDYFTLLAQVTGISQTAVNSQQALIDAATGSASPFSSNPAATSASNQGVIDAIGLSNNLLTAMNDNIASLGTILQNNAGGTNYNYNVPVYYY